MKTELRIIIAGGRDLSNYQHLSKFIKYILISHDEFDKGDIQFISGTAKCANSFGELFTTNNNYTLKKFPTFWNGKSKGTKNMILNTLCHEYGSTCI